MQTPKTRRHLTLVGPATHNRTTDEIRAAVAAVALRFAGDVCESTIPTPAQIEYALRQPVSMATVLFDLCQQLSVLPPLCVEQALDDPVPF